MIGATLIKYGELLRPSGVLLRTDLTAFGGIGSGLSGFVGGRPRAYLGEY